MHLLGAAQGGADVALLEGKAGVGHDRGRKAQVAGAARAGLDRVVGADAGDHEIADAARVQPAFQPGVDEGIGYVLLDRVLVRQARSRRAMLSSAFGLSRGGREGLRMPSCMSMTMSAVREGMVAGLEQRA